jgi:hypothetical protein
MITVRVFLRCAASANRPGGDFDTFIALPAQAFESGLHLDIAKFRAGVVGHEPPYEVAEVRVIGARPMSVDEMREKLIEGSKAPSRRCLAAIDYHQQQVASSESAAPPTTTSRPDTRRRASGR